MKGQVTAYIRRHNESGQKLYTVIDWAVQEGFNKESVERTIRRMVNVEQVLIRIDDRVAHSCWFDTGQVPDLDGHLEKDMSDPGLLTPPDTRTSKEVLGLSAQGGSGR